MSTPRVVFFMSGAAGLPGGIAAVNANILLALSNLVERREIELEVHSLLETAADRPGSLHRLVSFRGYGGSSYALSKFRFLLRILVCGLAGRWLVFERIGLARPLALLPRRYLSRTVVFAHGMDNWRDLTPPGARVMRNARLVMANSAFTLSHMRRTPLLATGFPGATCDLGLAPSFSLNVHPPVDDGEPIPLTAADGGLRVLGRRVLLLVARLDPAEREKGQDRLIAALPAIHARHPEVQLVFPGTGDDRVRLAALATGTGVAGHVFFPGHVSTVLLRRLYARCYAFVMPSRQEGFGLVYLEAMNYAKPCVGSRNDGAEVVIVHGETGLLVDDPEDIPGVTRTVLALLADPAAAETMGRNGFARLHARFTAERFRDRFVELLREAMA